MRRIGPPIKYTEEGLRAMAGDGPYGLASYDEAFETIEDLARDLLETRATLATVEECGWMAIAERDRYCELASEWMSKYRKCQSSTSKAVEEVIEELRTERDAAITRVAELERLKARADNLRELVRRWDDACEGKNGIRSDIARRDMLRAAGILEEKTPLQRADRECAEKAVLNDFSANYIRARAELLDARATIAAKDKEIAQLKELINANRMLNDFEDMSKHLDSIRKKWPTLSEKTEKLEAENARLRRVVEALPRCTRCDKIATRQYIPYEGNYPIIRCDDHCEVDADELSYAADIRELEAAEGVK